MQSAATIPVELVAKFKVECKAAQLTARAIMAIDRAKLDDSGDKFMHIRAVRIDHTVRELASGKSLRS